MHLQLIRLLRWFHKKAAWGWVPGKEGVMAKLIKFYVPANFHPPKTRTPEVLRGRIIDFRAAAPQKSA
jgi:hypothetical protein